MGQLPAGPMDRRIVIEQPMRSQSATGAPGITWITFATVWAAKRDLSGKEFFEARKEQAEVTTEFTMRWIAGLKREMRISYDGELYDIHHVAEIERREGWRVLASAQVA